MTTSNPQGAIDRLIGTERCRGMEMDVGKIKVMTISVQLSAVQIVQIKISAECGIG
jgi:hypothetical protein